MPAEFIYIGSDHNVEYTKARNPRTGEYLNTGTCTYELVSAADPDTVLASGTLSYEAESDGDYFGVIDSTETVLLVEGKLYFVNITFAQGEFNDYRRLRRNAAYRGGE